MEITLYKAALDIQNKISLCADHETGEIDIDQLEAIECNFTNKAIAVTAAIKTTHNTLAGLVAQREQINKQFDSVIKREQNKENWLHDYLLGAMKATGIMQIKSDDGLLEAKLYIDRDESLEIDEDAVFADSLLNPQKPAPARTPSKALIKQAIEAGEPISGARIVLKDRLVIK